MSEKPDERDEPKRPVYTLPRDEWDEMTPSERRAARANGIVPEPVQQTDPDAYTGKDRMD